MIGLQWRWLAFSPSTSIEVEEGSCGVGGTEGSEGKEDGRGDSRSWKLLTRRSAVATGQQLECGGRVPLALSRGCGVSIVMCSFDLEIDHLALLIE